MSTDHPNGGSFLAYPQIIRLLMDRTFRQDMFKTLPATVREKSPLKDLEPGILALRDRHHHPGRPGADARAQEQGTPRGRSRCRHHDLFAVDNAEIMFQIPRYVIKAGRLLVDQGEIREPVMGKTLHVAPEYDREVEADIRGWFEEAYSIRWRNYPVGPEEITRSEVVA